MQQEIERLLYRLEDERDKGRVLCQEDLVKLSQDFLSKVMSSEYSQHTKKNLISRVRKEIKNAFEGWPPILEFLKGDKDFYDSFEVGKAVRLQEELANKKLISLPDTLQSIENLIFSEKPHARLLGFLLATGRRYNEVSLENFSLVNDDKESLSFSGQLKTQEKKTYQIPTLFKASALLRTLSGLENDLIIDKNYGADYQKASRLCHKIFKTRIHELRAMYNALILAKEGFFESDSTIDPMLRAKEILGHAWESDATEAYKKYAVVKTSTPEGKTLIAHIEALNKVESITAKKDVPRRFVRDTTSILEKIWSENPQLEFLTRYEVARYLSKEYSNRTGVKQVGGISLKNFLIAKGIKEGEFERRFTTKDKRIKGILDLSPFSEEEKKGAWEAWFIFKEDGSALTLERLKELISPEFSEDHMNALLQIFKNS